MSIEPELLAPAGDLMKLKYAFAYGADAVYAGVPRFSLRVKENDFNRESIQKAVEVSHQLNKKIYLTLNIYPHNRKIEQFKETLQWMESLKPDAIIISDPGIILMSQKYCPSITLHLSTQANTVNWMSVLFWYQQGLKRIILSRELSINEISEIRQRVPEIELETFVHGAICVSYSGRCLLSNYFTHRDSNQGTCANSCRWDYKIYSEDDFSTTETYQRIDGNYFLEEKERPGQLLPIDEDENGTYIMNSRDLCAIRILNRLRDAGIDSFKIEGRNKSVYYVSVITRAYRQAMDDLKDGRAFNKNLELEMFTVANRGYITGFLEKNPRHLGENFKYSHSANQTHQFSGIVRQVDRNKGSALISVRNRISRGDLVEAIFPSDSVPFVINEILTVDGKSVQEAHGGGDDVFINVPEQIDENALIRKSIFSTPLYRTF
jgi:putative protease